MKNRTTALLSLLLAALFALAVFPACIERPTNDATPAPSEAAITENPTDVPITDAPTAAPSEEPTAVPTEAPGEDRTGSPSGEDTSEAEIIDEAWKAASRIGEVHGLKLKKELAKCEFLGGGAMVRFPLENGGQELCIDVEFEGGKPVVALGTSYVSSEAMQSSYDLEKLHSEYRDKKLTVTAEEIRKAGCTATEGEEYMKTLGRLYAEKLLARFEGAPADSPIHCYEIKIRTCEIDGDAENGFMIAFNARVKDIYAMQLYFDGDVLFNDLEDDPAHYCWLMFGGRLTLTKGTDGSWTGDAGFMNPA